MSHTITAAQRDALYDQILDRLSGIGDIELAIQSENYTTAERLGREYSDDLRLLLDGLGIGDGNGDPVELTAPPEVLRRVLPRLRKQARNHTASLEPELIEASEVTERNRLVSEACEAVLAGLDKAETPNASMSLFRCLRQVRRGDLRRPAGAASVGTFHGQGSMASKGALCGHSSLAGAASALQGQESPLMLNRLFISGVLVADPLTDRGRNEDRVTLLRHPTPGKRRGGSRRQAARSKFLSASQRSTVGSCGRASRSSSPAN